MDLLTEWNIINPWSVFSLIILAFWFVIYLTKKRIRREMLVMSIITTPFGLSEPVFIPAYWNPPSMFNLAANYHVDIEALIFCFAIGGIGSVVYEYFFNVRHVHLDRNPEKWYRFGYWFHAFAIASPVFVFIPFYLLTDLNPIYSASAALLAGGIFSMISRPDLSRKIIYSGVMFMLLYFLFFLAFDVAYPGAVFRIWNLPAISGILIFNVPLEELMFAFTFGMMWSSAYEQAENYRLKRVK